MKQNIKLALIQFQSVLGEPIQNLTKAEALIRQAAAEGAELICLPELFSTGYNLSIIGAAMPQLAETPEGPTLSCFRKTAKELKIHLIAPLALNLGEERPYNSAAFIGPEGEIIGLYHKCHLFDAERQYFLPGEDFPVFDTALGKIGLMICFDAGFPESARCLRLKGAELIVCPSAWRIQDKRMWDLNMPQRALENSCYVAAVNRYGREDTLYMGGFSMVCGPEGDVLAYQQEEKEAILYADISGERLAVYCAEGGPYLPYRRPKIYKREGITEE